MDIWSRLVNPPSRKLPAAPSICGSSSSSTKCGKNRPGDDIDLLRRAYDFAAEQHKTQFRPFRTSLTSRNPLEVAHLLADMKLDVTSIVAALLHDVVEDTKIPLKKNFRIAFGPDVARLVEGVTKISKLDLLAPEDRQAENVRKMLLAMVNDVRVVMVKLGDRLHNMRTLEFLAPEPPAAHRARNARHLRARRPTGSAWA